MKDAVWLVNPNTKKLVTPYEELPKCERLVAAQPFTVNMLSVVVAEDYDWIFGGDNDILVISKCSMGEQPEVQRIHFYEEEIPKGHPIKHMLAENVFMTDDYNGTDRLWLEIYVVEVDTDTRGRKAAVKGFQSLAATAGAIFPVIAPYAFGGSAVVSVTEKLVSALEKDTRVIKVPFAMYPGVPRPNRAPLQAGTYVAFAQAQDPSGFKLENGLLTTSKKASEVSYAVFEVVPKKQVSPKFVVGQKVATLLTQMKEDNPNSALAAIDFLKDTLTQYENFKKLNRYLQLKSEKVVSDEEKALLTAIEKMDVLKPFLPKK